MVSVDADEKMLKMQNARGWVVSLRRCGVVRGLSYMRSQPARQPCRLMPELNLRV